MSTVQPVNAAKVRAAMSRQGLTDREVDRLSGIGQAPVRTAVLKGVLHASTPLAKVRAYIETLGLTWGELLDEPTPATPTDALPPTKRQTTLARIITTSTRGIDLDHLCTVFGVTVEQLRADLDQLHGPLAALGFHLVVGNNNKVLLVRGSDPNYDDAAAQLQVLRDAADDLNLSAANTLYRAYKGTLPSRGLGNNDRVQVGALTTRGAIGPPASNDRVPLTADTLYCLEPATRN